MLRGMSSARILSVGTATPPTRYTQEEIAARYKILDPKIAALFRSSHIQSRYLYLVEPGPDGLPHETQGQLLQKHLRGALEIGPVAIERAMEPLGLRPKDVGYLCCITTTGFLAPGLTAHVIKHMGFRPETQRVDVVGMGCNAGLNGLQPVVNWARANPGQVALMACIEVCSAAYVYDGTMRTGVVNSLFGDGSAAIVVRADPSDGKAFVPEVLGFESQMIPEAIGAMRYDWDERAHKFSFYLDPEIPYAVGANAPKPVGRLLARFGLKKRDIAHWIVHSGGKKVVDAIKYNIGLTSWDVRHTTDVLRDYGNVSSASFLFSYQRLLAEGKVRRGDLAMLMTMGPGSQIETALVRF
jgi:polyketide synthase Type III